MEPFTLEEISLRLGLSLFAGVLLGFERESKGRAAGLKTTILVCMAAAMAMVLSEKYYRDSFLELGTNSNWRPDPARLAAGILAGMGFIGGGVIIQQGNLVRGVTTASVLWYVTIIGFCFGSGNHRLGIAGTAIGLVVLFLLPVLEKVIPNDWYGTLSVTTRNNGPEIDDLQKLLETLGAETKSADWSIDMSEGSRKMDLALKFKKTDLGKLQHDIFSKVTTIPGVIRVEWKT